MKQEINITDLSHILSNSHAKHRNHISAYKDYLDIMKEFLGENNPMIKRFQNLLKSYDQSYTEMCNEINKLILEE